MLINSCPSILEREIEVRGLDEKNRTFNEVVEDVEEEIFADTQLSLAGVF